MWISHSKNIELKRCHLLSSSKRRPSSPPVSATGFSSDMFYLYPSCSRTQVSFNQIGCPGNENKLFRLVLNVIRIQRSVFPIQPTS